MFEILNETVFGYPITTVIVFVLVVVAGMLLDLYYHKSDQPISTKDATLWSIFWVVVSLVFAGFLYLQHGSETASLFLAGYTLEKVLSVDNLFIFMAIFGWFSMIPENLRHRILYWGILGAILFRMIFVAIGTTLISLNGIVEIGFGLLVGWSAYMMTKDKKELEDFSEHVAFKLVKRFFKVTPELHGNNFFVTIKGAMYATPLFLCLVVIEMSDIMFAFDSVPAIIAVSKEPFIIYSAMIFAILGLRTMYFLLESMKKYFFYLERAVIGILFFIAIKLIVNAADHMWNTGYSIHHSSSLMVILVLLSGSIILSLIKNWKEK